MPRLILGVVLTLIIVSTMAVSADAQVKIPVEGTNRWRVQYADSTISLNDICPIAIKTLGTGKMPLYVNGRPVGFC